MTIQKRSRKQERATAKDLKGRTTPATGARWHSKGDVRSDKFLVECKITEKRSYSLPLKVWEKILNEARRDGFRTPAMCIEVHGNLGDPIVLAVLDRDTYEMWDDHNRDIDEFRLIEDKKSFSMSRAWEKVSVCEGVVEKHRLVIIPWKEFLNYAEAN